MKKYFAWVFFVIASVTTCNMIFNITIQGKDWNGSIETFITFLLASAIVGLPYFLWWKWK